MPEQRSRGRETSPSQAPTEIDFHASPRHAPAGTAETELAPSQPARPAQAPLQRIGRYRLIKKLGQGGMGAVYLAHDEQLDRRVALKTPRFEDSGKEVKERFYREARAAAAVEHPNICPIYDVGEAGGVTYLTMAFIEGRPLSEFIQPGKALRQRHVAAVVRKIALALAAAHEGAVVHRDLKPANIMLAPGKGPIVMDFGLALRASDDARLTRTGIVIGTPAYMSPEQVSGEPGAVGPASDIYSLGVILYELLVGRTPYVGNLGDLLCQIAMGKPPSPAEFRSDLEPPLVGICLKAIAKSPTDRYASMKELAQALDDYLKSELKSEPASSRSEPASSQSTMAVSRPEPEGLNSAAGKGPAASSAAAPPPLPARPTQVVQPPLHAPSSAGEHPAASFFAAMAESPPPLPPPNIAMSAETHPLVLAATLRLPAVGHKPPLLPSATRRRKVLGVVLAVLAGAAAVLLGVVLLVRTSKGLVQIELSDPTAEVEVKVDGEKVLLTGVGDPLELTVGEHHLLVTGKDFQTVSESFTVRRDGNPVLRISLRPTPSAAEPAAQTPKSEAIAGGASPPSSTPPATSTAPASGQSPSATAGPPPSATAGQSSVPRPAAASSTVPAARVASASDWVDVDPSIWPSWRWDDQSKPRVYKSLKDGVFTLDNGGVNFPHMKSRDVVIRAQIKSLGGRGNVGLSAGGQYALATNVDGKLYFGLGAMDSKGVFQTVARSTEPGLDAYYFYEMEVAAIGDRVTVRVNGKKIMEGKQIRNDEGVGINAWNAKAMFKNIQVRRP